jgi:hypothetical protein
MAAKLVFHRKGEWLNRRQQFKVLIDGREVGKIKRDETLEFELPAGTHVVCCKINWMSSNEKTIEITDGKNVYLAVGSGMKFFMPLYIFMLISLALPLVFRFAKTPFPEAIGNYRFVLLVPAVVYMLAHVTILRTRYLLVVEDTTNPFR